MSATTKIQAGRSIRLAGLLAVALATVAATGWVGVGATAMAGEVFRLKAAEGTLVVEVADPGVKVTLDGKDLVVAGPGSQEVRLKVGEGQGALEDVATISRDGKPIVTVRREPDDSKPGAILSLPENYRPEAPKQVVPSSRTVLAGPEVPGLDQAGALRPVALDEPSPVPLWPGSSITYLAYSPDGKTLAMASNFDREVLLIDAATRQRKATLQGHSARAWSLAFAPDGRQLAAATGDWGYSATSGKVFTWNLDEPETPPAVMATGIPLAFAVAYSPDGKTLAYGGWDDAITLYDLATHGIRATCRGHEDAVRSIAYSPDGRTIASAGSDRAVRLWEAATGRAIGEPFPPFRSGLSHLAFSPDGKLLAAVGQDAPKAGDDPNALDQVVVWDAATRKVVATPKGHAKAVFFVEFAPDGQTMATAGGLKDQSGEVKLWDTATWAERATLGGFRSWVGAVAFAPDGKTLVASADHGGQRAEVRSWDLAATARPSSEFRPDGTPAWSVAYSPDGRTLAVGGGRTDRHGRVWLRDVESGRSYWAYRTHLGVRSVAYARDGSRLVSGSFDGTVAVTDPVGREHAAFRAHDEAINALALAPDGKTVATASRDRTIALWDAEAVLKLRTLRPGEAWSLAFKPDGSTLAAGMKDGTITTWSVPEGRKLATLAGHTQGVAALAYSPDGRSLASGSWDRTLKLWDSGTSEVLATLEARGAEVRSLAFSPDGKLLATLDAAEEPARSPALLTFWDLATRAPRATLRAHAGRAWSVAFTPDGKSAATAGDDGLVRTWEVPDGR